MCLIQLSGSLHWMCYCLHLPDYLSLGFFCLQASRGWTLSDKGPSHLERNEDQKPLQEYVQVFGLREKSPSLKSCQTETDAVTFGK